MKLIVFWKSKMTVAEGHGEPIDANLAEAWARHGNATYPELVHWTAPPAAEASATDTIPSEEIQE